MLFLSGGSKLIILSPFPEETLASGASLSSRRAPADCPGLAQTPTTGHDLYP